MKRFILAVALFTFMATPALAGSKFAANVSGVALAGKALTATATDGWTKVFENTIKTPNQKDLLFGVSFETGLYTKTQVKGKNGEYSTANATAQVQIKVLLDGQEVNPGVVTYDKRSQTLSAILGGVIESCQDGNLDGIINVKDECVVTDEMIELILDTMGAHHFNFVAANVPTGEHKVEVYANTGLPLDDAYAFVGKGSFTVEEVAGTNAPDNVIVLQ